MTIVIKNVAPTFAQQVKVAAYQNGMTMRELLLLAIHRMMADLEEVRKAHRRKRPRSKELTQEERIALDEAVDRAQEKPEANLEVAK